MVDSADPRQDGYEILDGFNDSGQKTGVLRRVSNFEAHVRATSYDAIASEQRNHIVPTASSVPCGTMQVDSVTGTIQCLRYTAFTSGAGDDALAAQRLANGTTDTITLFPGSDELAGVNQDGDDGEITDIYFIVVGDGGTDGGSDNIVDSSVVANVNGQLATSVGTVAMHDVTAAELLAGDNMVHLQFDSDDAVRSFFMSLGDTYDSGTRMYINVGGRGHA